MRVILKKKVLELINILQCVKRLLIVVCALVALTRSEAFRHTLCIRHSFNCCTNFLSSSGFLLFLDRWLLQLHRCLIAEASASTTRCAALPIFLLSWLLRLERGEAFTSSINCRESATIWAIVQLASSRTCDYFFRFLFFNISYPDIGLMSRLLLQGCSATIHQFTVSWRRVLMLLVFIFLGVLIFHVKFFIIHFWEGFVVCN